MDISKTGRFISELRMQSGMTQKELAARLSVSDKAVSRWETGKGLPDPSSWLDLGRELKVSVNELLMGKKMDISDSDHQMDRALVETSIYIKKSSGKRAFKWAVIAMVLLLTLLALSRYIWAIVPSSDPQTAIMKYSTLHGFAYDAADVTVKFDEGFLDERGDRFFVHGISGGSFSVLYLSAVGSIDLFHMTPDGGTVSFFYLKRGPLGLYVTSIASGP